MELAFILVTVVFSLMILKRLEASAFFFHSHSWRLEAVGSFLWWLGEFGTLIGDHQIWRHWQLHKSSREMNLIHSSNCSILCGGFCMKCFKGSEMFRCHQIEQMDGQLVFKGANSVERVNVLWLNTVWQAAPHWQEYTEISQEMNWAFTKPAPLVTAGYTHLTTITAADLLSEFTVIFETMAP